MPEAYTRTRAHFSKIVTPNGLYAGWPGHGYYLAESWAFSGLVAELLVQSADDVIRIFPAWPKDEDAQFTDLRAQGGFLVSAEQKDGKVVRIQVESTVGGMLKVLSPWKEIKANGKPLMPDDKEIVRIETGAGEIVGLTP
jgi:hypothetical protein